MFALLPRTGSPGRELQDRASKKGEGEVDVCP